MGKVSLFVGSSTEGIAIAQALQEQLQQDADVTLWTDAVFELGKGNLESLIELTTRFDFAALVLTPDDLATIRGHERAIPRDNVVFELGLFMGRLGRERAFAVCDSSLPVWSDLAGISLALYEGNRSDGNVIAALGPASNQIRRAIARQGLAMGKRRLPDFWRPYLGEGAVIVIGHFAMPQFEGSGLVGLGDAMALTEIQNYCEVLGVSHPPVRDARRLGPDDRGQHLILLGGPDANRVTEQVLARIAPKLNASFESVEDLLGNAVYRPEGRTNELTKDVGVIIETANPFDREKRVMLLFGCYGYGTWAAARFSKTGSFLDTPTVAAQRGVECILETEVINDTPYAIKPVVIRQGAAKEP
jgi:hypothetical protein